MSLWVWKEKERRKNERKSRERKEDFICLPTLAVIIPTVSFKCPKRRKICPKMDDVNNALHQCKPVLKPREPSTFLPQGGL